MGVSVGQWVGSGHITKYQINLDLIEIIQDLWFVETPTAMGGCMDQWVDQWVGSGQNPPIHPPTHPWVGVSLQIINLQTELNYLDSVNFFKIFSVLTWSHPSTHPTTHPPTKPYTHPWVGKFFTDFKSSNGIEISWIVQVLLNFYWFWGSTPLGGGRWVDGGEGVWLCGWVSHAHTHAHACMYTYMHTHACWTW